MIEEMIKFDQTLEKIEEAAEIIKTTYSSSLFFYNLAEESNESLPYGNSVRIFTQL